MKDAVLMELARRWELDSKVPDGPLTPEIDLEAQGRREAKRECADTLRTLVSLIGDRST